MTGKELRVDDCPDHGSTRSPRGWVYGIGATLATVFAACAVTAAVVSVFGSPGPAMGLVIAGGTLAAAALRTSADRLVRTVGAAVFGGTVAFFCMCCSVFGLVA
ncbi:hypothetical protein R8Z50_19020 [Longispora sp. K20-0274]|uniref:hypothetical protein n=1 Tax=Longispora sp. K20-0274 TaxID=3088255 RepID=UPI00399B2337